MRAVRVVINEGPDSLTVAPGTTAFVLSVTMPLTAPVVAVTVCAAADNLGYRLLTHRAKPAAAAPAEARRSQTFRLSLGFTRRK